MLNFFKDLNQMVMMFNDAPGIGSAVLAVNLIFFVLALIIFLVLLVMLLSYFLIKNKAVKAVVMFFVIFLSLFFLAGIGTYVYMFYIEPNTIKVETVNLKIPGLSEALKNTRIVQFSDLHVRQIGRRERRLIELVNSLHPDIIVFTGGFTGEVKAKLGEAIPEAAKIFSSLKAAKGIYAVTDDTDDLIFKSNPQLRKQIVEAGVNILFDQSERITVGDNSYFWLVGVQDAFYGRNGLPNAMFMLPLQEPKIVITHSPDIMNFLQEYKVELVLVGKTHGGHVGLDLLRAANKYVGNFKYIRGLYKVKDTYMYVNRGIGGKTINLRFLASPEITVFTFHD